MKLNAVGRIATVTDRHDRLVLLGPPHHLEFIRHRIVGQDQRMVASGLQRIGDAVEDTLAVVHDGRRLAVLRGLGTADARTVDGTDRLVPQAHTEDRHGRREPTDDRHRDTRGLRPAWSGRDHELGRLHGLDLADGDLVVAAHTHLGPELAKILHEVVGKRVVVVDD